MQGDIRQKFISDLWEFYRLHKRDLPWRKPEADGSFDPYKILVSELMLQQTQVQRVVPKYEQFIKTFPDIAALADASLEDVYKIWQGLGYNRRAKFLRNTALQVKQTYSGTLPRKAEELTTLPGIGKNTAGAIQAYAYNQPIVFVETNIRTVYIHHFFDDERMVSDKEILPLIEQTLDHNNPREFYWALMDLGSHIKKTNGNNIQRSLHYKAQTKFSGSARQVRGKILRLLAEKKYEVKELAELINDDRFDDILRGLLKDGLVHLDNGFASIAD